MVGLPSNLLHRELFWLAHFLQGCNVYCPEVGGHGWFCWFFLFLCRWNNIRSCTAQVGANSSTRRWSGLVPPLIRIICVTKILVSVGSLCLVHLTTGVGVLMEELSPDAARCFVKGQRWICIYTACQGRQNNCLKCLCLCCWTETFQMMARASEMWRLKKKSQAPLNHAKEKRPGVIVKGKCGGPEAF